MRLSLVVNVALVLLLAMTNHSRLKALLYWAYSGLDPSFIIPTILIFYGLILGYLLVAVHNLEDSEQSTKHRRTQLIPYYNKEGRLQGWVREKKAKMGAPRETINVTAPSQGDSPSSAPKATISANINSPSLVPTPALSPHTNLPSENVQLSGFPLPSWDGFPDGRIHCHFTPQQLEDTSQLVIYWVADKLGGKSGSPDAASPDKGKISRFRCAGVVECSSRVCTVQIAPGANIFRQVKSECTCGFDLHHRTCKFEWSISRYRDGAVFETSNPHSHSRYTHSLSTPKSKPARLQSFITRQPVSLIPSQPLEPSSSERAESPGNSASQVNDGEHVSRDRSEPATQPELIVAPQNEVNNSDQEAHGQPAAPRNVATNSADEMILDPDAD
ncbi:hypothetical protein R3P38DRAFT_3452507 [Favolaschia claudopus]|uniref:Uncharacterized protein n=1 Tax=Favolaschia claudopus TaxID=2862362 RepID=A0AAV9ZJI4_9AGAR